MKNISKLVFFYTMLFVCAAFNLTADSATNRSLWVWGWASDLLKDANAQQEFFAFLQAPHGDPNARINRIFFVARDYNSAKTPYVIKTDYLTGTNAKYLRAFIKAATAQGVQVEYLDGQNIWATTAYMNQPISICQQVINYNLASKPEERFSGVHYDIEPHVLGAIWTKNTKGGKDNYNNELENNILTICTTCRSQIQASGLPMTLSLDLGSDYAKYVTDLMKVLLSSSSPLDYIGIMNYYNTYDGFVNGENDGGGVVTNLSLTKIPLIFGIEVSPPPIAPAEISFAAKGYTAMENMIAEVQANFGSAPNFAGFAIEYSDTYQTLQP